MVNACLHVICGNCGSKNLSYRRDDIDDDSGDLSAILCNNCATVHYLKKINDKISLYDENLRLLSELAVSEGHCSLLRGSIADLKTAIAAATVQS